jgi:predicted AAA+ superfamily ATPase
LNSPFEKELKVRDKYNINYEEFVYAPFIKIIVWARRVGKSYYVFQVIKKLLKYKKIKPRDRWLAKICIVYI